MTDTHISAAWYSPSAGKWTTTKLKTPEGQEMDSSNFLQALEKPSALAIIDRQQRAEQMMFFLMGKLQVEYADPARFVRVLELVDDLVAMKETETELHGCLTAIQRALPGNDKNFEHLADAVAKLVEKVKSRETDAFLVFRGDGVFAIYSTREAADAMCVRQRKIDPGPYRVEEHWMTHEAPGHGS